MRIACIHQGYELYGSDRSFVESVESLRLLYPSAEIEVVLPRDGPITELLRDVATRIVFEPLWILRRKALPRLLTVDLARLPVAVMRAIRRLRGFDLVYVNTSIIIDYAIAARFVGNKAVLHIHEIPEGLALKVLRALMRWSRAEIIFNSNATRLAFDLPATMRSSVIYNGVAGPAEAQPMTYDGQRRLRVLMLGRVNRIKGQEVLLEAISMMDAAWQARIDIRMVGSAFENDEPEQALKAQIAQMKLGQQVSMLPFTDDPSEHYRWADIVVVPSRRPESLGRVAIEAMAYGRPPVVSAIGGLMEVVEHQRTGWLVPPADPAALAAQLQAIASEPDLWRGFVENGRLRYESMFSHSASTKAIAALVSARHQKAVVLTGALDKPGTCET
ncbi:glycosyltransferase involved in cell wall biosynthesis [Neorhizobium sp. JUb45]|nr:glycosyltransferase family 4 protein [Neorhizobium sp. JUb45]TCQ98228.1 glycosyltransferase involved in cell wall biosynthesis [Neorhizobium sp. JUb45]